jgi:hypothetical protein
VISVEVADTSARRIAAKLAGLAGLRASFDDSEPSMLVADPLDDAQLAALQARLGVPLPEAYRALARHVGTIGAGPDLGLLGAGIAMPDEGSHGSAGSPPPDFRRPFPLVRAWHALDDDGTPRSAGSQALGTTSHPYDGAMQLTEHGDGCFTLLVLHGERAGDVWVDLSAEGGPLQPVAPLLDWYEDWLDDLLVDGLVEAMSRAMPPGHLSPLDEIVQRWGHLLDDRAIPDVHTPDPSGTDLAAQALWKLYRGRAAEAELLIARLEALPPEQADQLPVGMCEALTLWSHAEDAAAAMDPAPADHSIAARLMTHRSWRIRRLLAQNPATSELALGALAGDDRLEVRCAVAANPGASIAVLREALIAATALWSSRSDHLEALFVLELLARHPGSSAEHLARFAIWDEEWSSHRTAPWVVRGVAFNPAATTELLAGLASHAHPCVREAVARRRDATAATLTALAADGDATVREALAGNPAIPATALRALAADPAERVRYRIAERADLPTELQLRLACDFATSVVLAMSERAHLDPAAAELLALRPPIVLPGEDDDIVHDGPYLATGELAIEPSPGTPHDERAVVPPLDLEIYLNSEHRAPADDLLLEHRQGAALATIVTIRALAHPGYPAPLLTRPCRAPEDLIGYAIAEHPWLEDAALRALVKASYAPTRARIAARAALPADVVEPLLEDPSPMVQRKLALRCDGPMAPATMLERWAMSELVETRAAAAAAPHAAASVLHVLARDREAFVRRAVAANSAADQELVAALAIDADPDVRRAVTWRATVPAAIIETLSRDSDPDVRAWATWRHARDNAFASE